jgi:hypothetical protein
MWSVVCVSALYHHKRIKLEPTARVFNILFCLKTAHTRGNYKISFYSILLSILFSILFILRGTSGAAQRGEQKGYDVELLATAQRQYTTGLPDRKNHTILNGDEWRDSRTAERMSERLRGCAVSVCKPRSGPIVERRVRVLQC